MTLNSEQFDRLRQGIASVSGIALSADSMSRLLLCIDERRKANGIPSLSSYLEAIDRAAGGEDLQNLDAILEQSETYFFRDAHQLWAFSDELLPRWIEERERSGRRHVTAWSAGCSTGDEAYTIAILLLEALQDPSSWSLTCVPTPIAISVAPSSQ